MKPACFFNRARQEAHIEEIKRARGQSETHMGWLPFRILFWPSLRNKFLSGRHGLEVKTSQGRRAEAIGERALSTRKEIREISSP